MKYSDILNDVLDGKWVKWHKGDEWVRMKQDGTWEDESFNYGEINRAVFGGDQWIVKPEELYVWVWTGTANQTKISTAEGVGACTTTFMGHELNSKKEVQKYKLVLMED